MTGNLRVIKNRLNAKRSTGPKTRAGKLRSSKNATSHGLLIPIDVLPSLKAQRDQMARRLVEAAGLSAYDAKEGANALLLIKRTRAERARLFSEAGADVFPSQALSTLRYERNAGAILFRMLRGA
jgi:hypothetical protein